MSILNESLAHDIREFHNPHNLKERAHDFVMMPARVKWFLFASVVILGICVAGLAFAAQPAETTFQAETFEGAVLADSNIVFEFTRPMSREVYIEISPSIPGNWHFEGRLTRLHLAQDFRFEPLETWLPDTTYTVSFKGLHNVFGIGETNLTKQFTFSTQVAPEVVELTPTQDEDIRPDTVFTLSLDQPNTGLVKYDVQFDPVVEYETEVSDDLTEVVYTPVSALAQGTRYNASVVAHNTRLYRETGEVAFEGEGALQYEASWTVSQAPGVAAVTPTGTSVLVSNQIRIDFDQEPIENNLVNITLEPAVEGVWTKEGASAVFTPSDTFAYDTTYTIIVPKDFQTVNGGYFESAAEYSFSTIGAVKVVAYNPSPGATGVAVDRNIRIDFDQAVVATSAQQNFSITPHVEGSFSWEGSTMIFTPTANLLLDTGYTVTLAKAIESIVGLPSNRDYAFTFNTQPTVVKLAVALDYQDRPLSCEVAALKMALVYKGFAVSETDLMNHVGYDPTPHVGNVWGNPYKAFVGDIDGKQSTTGYGVYWEPIARAAQKYTEADYFVNGSVQILTDEISKGNPVVVWGNAGTGRRSDWYTPDGELIYAFDGEHARTAIGFIGPKDNPTHIIVNDPIFGEITYTRSRFEANWAMLFKAGVIVR